MTSADAYKQMFSPLTLKGCPLHPLRTGETWKHSESMNIPGMGKMKMDCDYRFVDWRMLDGRRVAEIEWEGQMQPDQKMNAAAPGFQMDKSGIKSTGSTYFDPEIPAFRQSVLTQTINMSMSPTSPGAAAQGKIEMSMSQKVNASLIDITMPTKAGQ